MRTASWIAVRVASCAATLTILSFVVFWATEVLPGDAVGVVSGPDATDAEREAVRLALGLDRPPLERYGAWVDGLAHGDLGTSLVSGREVVGIVVARLGASMAVLVPAAAGIVILAGVFGTIAGMRAGGRVDRALSGVTLGLIGTPDFLIATALLVVFAVWLPILPAVAIVPAGQSLWQHPELIALPSLALALGGFGSTMRLLRASVAQTVATPFAEFARLNGIRGLAYVRTVVVNAAPPAVHAFTIMIAGLLGGGIVVETLFNVPGLGYELTRAVGNRDVPLVQGLALVLGAVVLMILLVGDIIARVLQQRTRRQEHA
ncbi:ABC transporter permease [Microbacterium marinilacus]|uniref:ABC transporter permease n=1 Tax=Microbacterium marinilacus TaxID=415209 RepID=A0ABP7BJU1_9MICO|nr:ABC transporter permease [Microbacterium marinilacus]MBY0687594.1 ABC transporter permease [Microbacterium marinilacus]